MAGRPHPLNNLSEGEISRATSIVKQTANKAGIQSNIWFKSVSIAEPPKAILLPYLDAEAAGIPIGKRPFVPRCIEVIWTHDSERTVTASIVSLDTNTEVDRSGTGKGQHGPNDRFEVMEASEVILEDPMVKEAIKKLGLPAGTIVQCDPWMYGADKFSDTETHKLLQPLLYARAPHNHEESNQYAFPIPISPRYDLYTKKVVAIDHLATGGKQDGLAYQTGSGNPFDYCAPNEYYQDLVPEPKRTDIKPLHINQPQGPSFTVTDGNLVSWQKWTFRVGFSYREGLTLHNIRYDKRPVFYRLSVSEMTVPYGGESHNHYW